LGAGTGLPGLLAAKLGAHVYLTDQAVALASLRQAIRLNHLSHHPSDGQGSAQAWVLCWGEFAEDGLLRLTSEIDTLNWIIGADVFYEPDRK
jgi:predicted nicotinamide N-methyase